MGWATTLVISTIMALAIIGLGIQTFANGVVTGAQTIATSPQVAAVASQAQGFVTTLINNAIQSQQPH